FSGAVSKRARLDETLCAKPLVLVGSPVVQSLYAAHDCAEVADLDRQAVMIRDHLAGERRDARARGENADQIQWISRRDDDRHRAMPAAAGAAGDASPRAAATCAARRCRLR